jgi:two-component system cell cycle sensor histidine kinase PleC
MAVILTTKTALKEKASRLGRTLQAQVLAPLKAAILAVSANRNRLASPPRACGRDRADEQAKAVFLAGMGHEFRTPLTAIVGFSDILLEQGPDGLEPARQREYVECIHASSAHLLELVNDWLDLSKLETGRMEMRESQVDLGVLLHQTLRLARAQARQADLTLSTQISPGLPDLWADRRMLMQVLLNLLSNAIKFTPAGGTVSLEARCLSGGGLRIAVCDSGIGLEDSDIALLADPFVQIDNGVNRRTRGSGLGLYLARSMIELHGARLAISSRPREGFCASFVLPQSRIAASVAVVAS